MPGFRKCVQSEAAAIIGLPAWKIALPGSLSHRHAKAGAGKRFQFNLDYCVGCGMCVAACPCGAITMEAEEI